MRKSFILSISVLSFLIIFSLGASFANAQGGFGQTGGDDSPDSFPVTPGSSTTPPPGSTNVNIIIPNPFQDRVGNSIFGLLRAVINDIVIPVGGVLAVLAFIYSGFLYVTAQGKEAQLETAHKALLYTAIGTAVLLGSWVLANVVCETIEQLGGPSCPSL